MFLVILIIVVILALWYYTSSKGTVPAPTTDVAKTPSASETAAVNLAAAEAPKGALGSGSTTAGAISAGSTSGNIPPVAIITTTTQANVSTTVGSSSTGSATSPVPAPIVPKPSVVGTTVAVTGATATAGQLSSMLPTYTFYPGMTFGGNDLANTGLTDNVPKLASWCDANAQCKGFTTDAWMKSVIVPQDKWYKWSEVPTKGLYVKK